MFRVTVTGPSFPEGKVIEVTNGVPNDELTALLYGGYQVTSVADANGNPLGGLYITTLVQPSDTLHIDKQSGELIIQLRELPLGRITVDKRYFSADGVEYTAEEAGNIAFKVKITGPGHEAGWVVDYLSTSRSFDFTGFAYGTYTVEELGASDPELVPWYGEPIYPTDTDLPLDAVERGTRMTNKVPYTFTIGFYDRMEEVSIVNTELAVGKIRIEKRVQSSLLGYPVPGRSFEFELTGPSFPQGTIITVPAITEPVPYEEYFTANDTAHIVEGLKAGQYTLREIGAESDYIVYPWGGTVPNASHTETVPVGPIPAYIDANSTHISDYIVVNRERNLGQITIVKQVLASDGTTVLADPREFTINVDIVALDPGLPAGGQAMDEAML